MIRNRLKAHRQNQVPVSDLQLDHPDAQAPHVGAPSNPFLYRALRAMRHSHRQDQAFKASPRQSNVKKFKASKKRAT